MPDFTKPLFARSNQVVTLLAEAKAAGYLCVKLDVMGGSKYRCHFAEEKILQKFHCVDVELPIQSSRNENPNA